MMNFTIVVPSAFNFWRTVYSHGWCSLRPFEVDKEQRTLNFAARLGSVVGITLDNSLPETIRVRVGSPSPPGRINRREVESIVRSCLRLGEDYGEFYAAASQSKGFGWVPKSGSGRLLRAPSVFEDLMKMICTTNCSWALTETMVNNLCDSFGEQLSDGSKSFPGPDAIADSTESFLRKKIRAGYRAPYLLELSRRVAKMQLDPEAWRGSSLPTAELFEEVRSVKGVGPYAAGNILKLLGRYDYLAIDSWCRKRFSEIHRNGRKVSDRTIEKSYEPFGKWKGLFFWMDLTKEWYTKKFPF